MKSLIQTVKKVSWHSWFAAALLFFPATSGFASDAAAQKLNVVTGSVQQSGSRVKWDLSVTPSPAGKLDFSLIQPNAKPIHGEVKVRPVNLWILLDGSNLCSSLNIDKRVNLMLDSLAKELHPDSVVSIGSYTGATSELSVAHRRISDLEDVKFSCENHQFSGSYEKLLTLFLNQKADDRTPTYAWIYTSGNIQLSEAALKRVKARNLKLRLFLYNPFLQADLRETMDEQSRYLGRDRISLGTAPAMGTWPERWFRFSFDAPFTFQGRVTPVNLSVQQAGKDIAVVATSLTLVEGSSAHFWSRYGWISFGLLFLAAAIYGSVQVSKVYRNRKCLSCRRFIRSTEEGCRFCLRPSDACLVGSFNHYDRRKAGKEDLVVLRNASFEIGPSRKSGIRVPRLPGRRRRPVLRIVKERLNDHDWAHRIIPVEDQLVVTVNGVKLNRARYLASGDRIRLEDYQTEVTFFQGEGT